jgi:DNA-binding NarL/FixJ family response regulator
MKSATISSNAKSLHHYVSQTPAKDTPLRFGAPDVTHDHRKAPPLRLTPRQLEVLSLLCEGLPNKLICRQLKIATGTVKVHISVILRELGVTSRLQAVVAASRRGLFGEYVQGAPQHAHPTAAEPRMMPRILTSRTSTDSAHGGAAS